VAMAIIVAVADPRLRAWRAEPARRTRTSPRRRPVNPWPLRGGAVVALGLLAVFLSQPVLADLKADVSSAAPSTVARASVDAADLFPLEAPYHRQAGSALENQAGSVHVSASRRVLLEQAWQQYREAARLQPLSARMLNDRARVEALLGDAGDIARFKTADATWRAALALDPHDWELHLQRALGLNAWSNATGGDLKIRAEAARELDAVVAARPTQGDAWATLAKVRLALGQAVEARQAFDRAVSLGTADDDLRHLFSAT